MLEIKHRVIIDELNNMENSLLEMWDRLPSIYDTCNPIEIRKYENIAGAINYIEKCKYLLDRN